MPETMTTPQRIQRRRTKGWRAPEGAVYVGRGSKWGNPFTVASFYWDRSAFHACPFPCVKGETPVFMRWTHTISNRPLAIHCNPVRDRGHAVQLFRRYVAYNDDVWTDEVLRELRGKNLMCWCTLDQPCHADVLLELANQETP